MALVDDFVAALENANRRLFHFTDSRNIDSIKDNGLVPTRQLIQEGVKIFPGGDTDSLGIDQHHGYDDFVRLSFCRQHPMSHVARQRGTIEQVRILSIAPKVLLREGVKIADRVATANDATIGEPNGMIPNMDLEATYKYLDWKIPENSARRTAAEKWEIMVPNVIETADIFGL